MGEPHLVDLPRFQADASAEEVADAVAHAGCAVIERLAPHELLDRFAAEIDPWLDATSPGGDDFSGRNTRRTGGLLQRSPAAAELVAHPAVLDIMDRVLWSDKTTFQLHLTQLIAIGPHSPVQAVHRDQWAFDFFPFPAGIELQCNTMWALTDFTEANGATRVMPGSHRFEDKQRFTIEQTIAAEMPRGSVLLYTGSLYHGGGPNSSAHVRMGINIDYTVGWLRQEENQYLAVDRATAAAFPERLQRLIGYGLGAYALGYVDDLRDPLDVLLGTTADGPPTFTAQQAAAQ